MSDFQNEMNQAVRGFVAQIAELARHAARDTLESAFGSRGGRNGGRRPAVTARQRHLTNIRLDYLTIT